MSEWAIGTNDKSQNVDYVPFWKKDQKTAENIEGGACHMAFNSAWDVAAGRENYRMT